MEGSAAPDWTMLLRAWRRRSDDPYHGADARAVAIEPVDGRKGIDSLVRVCQASSVKTNDRLCFCVQEPERTSIRLLSYDGQDIGLRKSAFPKDDLRGGLHRAQRRSGWRLTKRSC